MIDHIHLNEKEDALVILDQSVLPSRREYLTLRTEGEMWEAIRSLRVRGAPAIGIFAGFAVFVLSQRIEGELLPGLRRICGYLASSRPTAVNLTWALERMYAAAERGGRGALRAEAQAILEEDIATCRAIAENGLSLLRDGATVLTHCNAGPLATSRYGTALGPLILGTERGMTLHAYADETRPLLQGARLTAYELMNAGVDVTLICDDMASYVMRQGKIDAVMVGCDRIARNGDVANKIGTSGVAILARHYGIPFYVLGPGSTVDTACPDGDHVKIELRDGSEITDKYYAEPVAPRGVKTCNPAFDVTPADLITAIITEKGIHYPPYAF